MISSPDELAAFLSKYQDASSTLLLRFSADGISLTASVMVHSCDRDALILKAHASMLIFRICNLPLCEIHFFTSADTNPEGREILRSRGVDEGWAIKCPGYQTICLYEELGE